SLLSIGNFDDNLSDVMNVVFAGVNLNVTNASGKTAYEVAKETNQPLTMEFLSLNIGCNQPASITDRRQLPSLPPIQIPNVSPQNTQDDYKGYLYKTSTNRKAHEIAESRSIMDLSGNEIRIKGNSDARLNKSLTLSEFLIAFGKYKSIICEVYPGRQEELDLYETDVIDISNSFGGGLFYDYHIQFATKAAAYLQYRNIKVDWSVRDNDIFISITAGRKAISCTICNSTLHFSDFCPRKQFSPPQQRSNCCMELAMWRDFLDNWNGLHFFLHSNIIKSSDLDLYTNSSPVFGFGGYFQGQWFSEPWPTDCDFGADLYSTALIELHPIVVAAMLWGILIVLRLGQLLVELTSSVLTNKSDKRQWVKTITKCIVPACILEHMEVFDRAGYLYKKESTTSLSSWQRSWFILVGKNFCFFSVEKNGLEILDLRKLISLNYLPVISSNCPSEVKQMISVVFPKRTLYIIADNKEENEAWFNTIKSTSSVSGRNLHEQQLTEDNIPVPVDRCIEYVANHGMAEVGIYRQAATEHLVKDLLDDFSCDARAVRLDHIPVHVVANALKRFFRNLPEPLLTKIFHDKWIEAS
uniref:Uncharacterized protein LOC102807377 n=1 Tax=Saccoglossus kowalevskii TaxID=10224 RepID=A0ABM0MUF5_SACKO